MEYKNLHICHYCGYQTLPEPDCPELVGLTPIPDIEFEGSF